VWGGKEVRRRSSQLWNFTENGFGARHAIKRRVSMRETSPRVLESSGEEHEGGRGIRKKRGGRCSIITPLESLRRKEKKECSPVKKRDNEPGVTYLDETGGENCQARVLETVAS